jgi:hypothetical protein
MKIEPGGQFTMGVKIPYDRCQSKKRKRKKSTQIPISAPDAQILRVVDYFVAPCRRRTVISKANWVFNAFMAQWRCPK